MSTGPAGAPIQKQDPDATSPYTGVTDQFRTQITDAVNALPKQASDTGNFFGYNSPYIGYLAGDDYGGVPPLQAGQTLTTSPLGVDVAGANVSASVLVTLFQNTASVLTSARNYQVLKTYLSIYGNSAALYGPALGNLTSPYRASPGSFAVGLTANTNVNAVALDAVVNTVDAAIAAVRVSTVTFNETWCHTSCHSSHSSRSRR